MKRLLLILVLNLSVGAQTATVTTLAQITGDAATHQIATSGTARWVQINALTGNGAVIRVGDSATSATRGLPIAAGAGMMYPPMPIDTRVSNQASLYRVSTLYYYAASGDKLNVLMGQ